MSFQQGLSGLNSSSRALDVLGNNIANSSTVGFKSAESHFADVYANSLSGGGASQVGIGSTLSAIQQTFSQGNITSTNNPLDISVNGNGFYRLSNSGAITYTRNGQFHLDNQGYIINDQNMRLTGYQADENGIIAPSSPIDIKLSAAQVPPRATNDLLSGNLTATINLNSNEDVPINPTFKFQDPQSYNFSTALSVYDTLGVAHTMTMYFARASAGGPWNVYASLDTPPAFDPLDPPTTFGTLTFDENGRLPASTILTLPTWDLTTGAASPWQPGQIDFSSSTQYGSASSVDRLTQGGYAAGSLSGLSVGSDGVVQGRYNNGQTRNLGQIVLATFANPNGLQSLGNNQWSLSSVSGPELIGAPSTGGRGVLQSSSIEESNVDLTKQLVDMITQQRNYQANAQTIKTQDSIMQTLVNLR